MKTLNRLVLLLAVAPLPGCIAAAAAAGAGGAVYVTTRGAEAVVEGQPASLEPRIRAALTHYNVSVTGTSTEDGGDKQAWQGKTGDLEVSVTAERQSPTTTKLSVTARRNVADWDKDFAEQVLQRVVSSQ